MTAKPSALCAAATVFVVQDVLKSVAHYKELKSRGARTRGEPSDYPYGMRDFEVSDLDGNQLSFGMESKK